MKRVISLILVLVLSFALCACGNSNTSPTTVETTPDTAIDTNPPEDDAIEDTSPPMETPDENEGQTKTISVELTTENWTDYFDLDGAYFDYRWYENAFGEAEGFWHANLYVPLKEEYKDKLVVGEEKIAYEVQYDGGNLKTQIDLTNRTVELQEDWENIKKTGEQFSVVQEAAVSQLQDTGLEIGCWEVAQYNTEGTTWFRAMNQMLRIQGTLVFAEE